MLPFAIVVTRIYIFFVTYTTEGEDYQGFTQEIEFPSASTMTVSVMLTGDSVVEGSEWFIGHLRGTTNNGVILTTESINITILDDDSELLDIYGCVFTVLLLSACIKK